MAARARTEQGEPIATTAERGRGKDPYEPMSFRDEVAAWLRRQGDGGLYTEDHFRLGARTDFVVAALVVLLFVGSFLGFIAWLAATR